MMKTKQLNSISGSKSGSLLKPMVAGAVLGLILISIFLLGTGEPNPEWGKYWIVKPLLVVPLSGAMGGLCLYLFAQYHNLVGLNKSIAIVLSLIVFIIGLWLGTVLGLNGTYWD